VKTDLENIYKRYIVDIGNLIRFLEDFNKFLVGKEQNRRKITLDFSDEDRKEYLQAFEFMKIFVNNAEGMTERIYISDNVLESDGSKGRKLHLKSDKVVNYLEDSIFTKIQKRYLAEMAIAYLISYQEAFFKEYFQKILISQRDSLKSEKHLTYKEICTFETMDSLILHMAERQIDNVMNDGIDGIRDYLEKRFKIVLKSEFADWDIVKEASLRRNLIIHNRGITNKKYCQNTGYKKTNELLITDLNYVLNAANAILSFIDFIHSRTIAKL